MLHPQAAVSPFLDDPAPSPQIFAPLSSPVALAIDGEVTELRQSLPRCSEFAIADMDAFTLISLQLLDSRLQGFDVAVLLFLAGNFQHRIPFVPLAIKDIAEALQRNPAQIRRSVAKLRRLGWLRVDNRNRIMVDSSLVRSANVRHQMISRRLAQKYADQLH